MASLTLYGSNVANSTLTSACNMSTTTGGTETSNTTTYSGSNNWAEIFSQGGSTTGASSPSSTPSGKGWCYLPGAGSFATGNWSASVALKETGGSSGDNTATEIRFYRYSGGTYTLIGTITNSTTSVLSSRTVVSFSATSMASITFAALDLLYIDLWWEDTATINTDNPAVFVSSSSSAGVANDMQVTTSSFTASSTSNWSNIIVSDNLGAGIITGGIYS